MPFAFDYGTQHFAAGVYTVSMREPDILTLSNGNRSAWAMIQTGYDPTQHKSGYVVFRKYGDRYFLTEYAPPAALFTHPFSSLSRTARGARLAANPPPPSRVQLALMSNYSGGVQSK